jgi:hypothetical protein
MNIPALEANAEAIERQITRLEADLEAKRLELQLTRNDLAAACLQAWYRDNPGIELKEGDELLVTEMYRRVRLNGWNMGAVSQVVNAYFEYDLPMFLISVSDTQSDNINIYLARSMRQAWLQEHGEAQS